MHELDSEATMIPDVENSDMPKAGIKPRSEIDLFVAALLLRKHLSRNLLFAVAGFLLMLVLMLTAKVEYSATAVLLVPQNSPSASSLALQMATGGAGMGALGLLGGGGQYQVYEDILRSRTVADRLIEQFHLKDLYRVKDREAAEKVLASRTKLVSEKEGMIRVTVEDTDPKRAANIANAYLSELDRMNQDLAITSAGQQREYFEREMVKEKNALEDAEVDLKRTQEQAGVLIPQSQALAHLSAIEQTRAEIRFRQVELASLMQGATGENPSVVQLRSEIDGLEGQLNAMEKGGGGPAAGTPTSKVPEISLEYLRKAREVKFHETLFEMLARQFELAKQEEGKTVSMIQVLDKAIPPSHKSWPPRTLFCILGLLGGAFIGAAYTFIEEFFERVMQNPDNKRKYRTIFSMKDPLSNIE
ncbi:MAG TPA: Wzz/FepE/Etk N-terminal domain-containing protein [Edaphobacter sp.]|uniref:GumC family protein n=1 Tax=Edaphobacter sp. TaxID=1934404 RepID=UPI002C4AE5FF|nr:Wzz/FepE/Etk N-terminal domain-containing protein [Edaphobacter sp.]HUZ97523.1 Wzz/FepE/Etk N-terminal domain-containing protein [Edaphobacter sp.]